MSDDSLVVIQNSKDNHNHDLKPLEYKNDLSPNK